MGIQSGERSALTKAQEEAAAKLLAQRPEVLPGTRAIVNKDEATKWHNKVNETIRDLEITRHNVGTFCDLAGVAD